MSFASPRSGLRDFSAATCPQAGGGAAFWRGNEHTPGVTVLFNSKIFVVFLAVVLLVYYPLSDRAKITFLLMMSYIFYGFWDPALCSLIALSTTVDFICGRQIAATPAEKERTRKHWLWLSLSVNLGMLGFFKYADFFIEEFCLAVGLLGMSIDPDRYMLDLVLPVGISFYTFQTMAYTIDIYRGKIKPEVNFWRFALYVSFFPQLVAGPVERAQHLLPQFSRPFRLSIPMVREGVFLILLGFVKKVIIADRIARDIEPYFDQLADNSVHAVAVMLLFTCQIYVDFSSYSDIAIGLGLLLGYNIRPNFNLPFVVPSIPERWRRWHISMSHWFRDYIFIPLGGSRRGTFRTQLNIIIVMFLSGLWHGASNNFVVWGLGNGFTMVGHKLITRPLRAISTVMNRNPVSRVGYYYLCCWNTFCMIATINIFFRCPDWETAKSFVRKIFLSGTEDYIAYIPNIMEFPYQLTLGFVWIFVVFTAHEIERYFKAKDWILANPRAWAAWCVIALWSIISFGIAGPEFIYYQF